MNATRAGARSFGSEEPHGKCQDFGRQDFGRKWSADIVFHGDGVEHGPSRIRDQLGGFAAWARTDTSVSREVHGSDTT